MRSFDRAARTYESFGFIQREMAEWLGEWIPSQREGTAIEVAAGTGFLTRHLLPWNGRLLVTDASPSMVALGAENRPELNWKVRTADDLPDISADWVFSSSYLQWAGEPVELLRHWKNRLVPGGRILSGLFVDPTLTELNQVLPENVPLRWRSADEWKEAISGSGLQLVRTESTTRHFAFPSCLELLRTLHGVGAAPTRRLSAGALRKAMGDYDSRFAFADGVRSTWTFFRFEATISE